MNYLKIYTNSHGMASLVILWSLKFMYTATMLDLVAAADVYAALRLFVR